MAAPSSSNVSLKLLIDAKGKKVLFAEAGKEFVDFLFHILSLPVGTVIRLLQKDSMVGCLGKLYDSIENLSDTYMQPNQTKDSILNPKIANTSGISGATVVPLLLPAGEHDSFSRKLYVCSSYDPYVSDDPKAVCPQCRHFMSVEVPYVARTVARNAEGSDQDGGFVKGVVTYMVMDDLVVTPMSTISGITMLNKFHVKEVSALEEKVITFGMAEGLKLLKASLQCKNVLSSVFLT